VITGISGEKEDRREMTVDEIHHTCALYLDLELTYWSGPPPPGMKQEIIEIGIVEMDLQTLNITREAAYFVRPRRWEISEACSKLTGITTEDIRSARPFLEVLATMTEQFRPSGKMCGTWGEDAVLIARACNLEGMKTPLRNLLDVSLFFQRAFLLKNQFSLSKAVEMLGLDFEGVPHGALVDARNTAFVHAAIIRRMRREADPPPLPTRDPIEAVSRSIFAEKLSKCLRVGEEEGTPAS
jgi:inhibitor of KinA sporulation pathway (predicted exonuclease)